MTRRLLAVLSVGLLPFAFAAVALTDSAPWAPLGSLQALSPTGPGETPEAPTGEEGKGESPYEGNCLRSGCHEDLVESKAIHGPVAVLACDPCHAPVEGAEHEFELARDDKDLCTFCHGMPEPADIVHEPFEKQSCTGCHDTHFGTDRRFLVEVESTGELCLLCHSKEDEEEIPYAHEPYESGDCSGCHAAHQSSEDGLLRAAEPGVCLGCHAELAAALRAAKSIHKPVEAGACSSCHRSHGSEFPGLLTAAYPEGLYAPYSEDSYELCFACHSASGFSDPADRSTRFRDGGKNLHALHVNKEDKGRTCGACHSAHATGGPNLVKKEAAFGEWSLPIGFEPTERGGTCTTGCHKAYSYDRGPEEEGSAPSQDSSVDDPGAEGNAGKESD